MSLHEFAETLRAFSLRFALLKFEIFIAAILCFWSGNRSISQTTLISWLVRPTAELDMPFYTLHLSLCCMELGQRSV